MKLAEKLIKQSNETKVVLVFIDNGYSVSLIPVDIKNSTHTWGEASNFFRYDIVEGLITHEEAYETYVKLRVTDMFKENDINSPTVLGIVNKDTYKRLIKSKTFENSIMNDYRCEQICSLI